jgi:hypothetical protein
LSSSSCAGSSVICRRSKTADRQEGELAQAKSIRLKDEIASLKAQMQAFKALEVAVHAAPVNGARNLPNYGEVKFLSLAGQVISRGVDRGLRFLPAGRDV